MALVNLAYSRKRDLLECPKRYELKYVLGLKETPDNRRWVVANTCDLSLSSWIKAGFPINFLVNEGDRRFKEFCKNNFVRWKNPSDKASCNEIVVNVLTKLETDMDEHHLCRDSARQQINIEYEVNGVLLKGRPDLYYEDTLDIFDLKTTKDKRWLDWKQLVYYWVAASHQLKKAHGHIGFLAPLINPSVQIREITKEDKELFVSELTTAKARVATSDFPMLGDEQKDCYMCLMKQHCPRFKPVYYPMDGSKLKW